MLKSPTAKVTASEREPVWACDELTDKPATLSAPMFGAPQPSVVFVSKPQFRQTAPVLQLTVPVPP